MVFLYFTLCLSAVHYTHKTSGFRQFDCYRINMLHLIVNLVSACVPAPNTYYIYETSAAMVIRVHFQS